MAKYFTYSGLYYAVSHGDKTQFVVQTDKLENFNDSPLIVNAAYVNAPIFGFKELHITRVCAIYEANAANTDIFMYVCTGNRSLQYMVIPVGCNCTVKAGTMLICSPTGIDIPVEPQGAPGTTSRVSLIIIGIVGVNAADDCTVTFEGYYRGEPSPTIEVPPQRTAVDEINVWPWKR